MRIKIIGAGSIGNHMAGASRELGWDVTVVDVSREALTRMRDQIYPSRYGSWDPAIRLSHENVSGSFDLIVIGTPPDHHLSLALEALAEEPKGILIEKPLCPPTLDGADTVLRASRTGKTAVFVGYDHVVGKAARAATGLMVSNAVGDILTIDVEFREHWAGIFQAHPWLRGPQDTYLGFSDRGGGASGEHSHALNLWQHFAHAAGGGRVHEISGMLKYVRDGDALYDQLCSMNLRTAQGLCGRVVQDVVTRPSSKRARIQGTAGAIEWVAAYEHGVDAVVVSTVDGQQDILRFPKRRVDDFIEELKHVADHLGERSSLSDIRLERGLDTALVIAAAHAAERLGTRIRVSYTSGYRTDALVPA
jgi:predicted dehydrogenase